MADVFISYAREDREVAARLANRLQRTGLTVWWDRGLLAGDDIERVIDTQIEAAKAIVVMWSANSVGSTWVRSEASAGHAAKKLVPILLDTADLPRPFDQIHTLDFAKWNRKWDRRMAQLVRAIRQVASGEPLKPERSVLAKRSRRIISVGALASTALVALAVVGDISGLISSLRGNPGDQELKGQIEQIDERLVSLSEIMSDSEQTPDERIITFALRHLADADVSNEQAVLAAMKHRDPEAIITFLKSQFDALDNGASRAERINLLHQIGAFVIESDPAAAAAIYREILLFDEDDALANISLGRLLLRENKIDDAQLHLQRVRNNTGDTTRAHILASIHLSFSHIYRYEMDESIALARDAMDRAITFGYTDLESHALSYLGIAYQYAGDYDKTVALLAPRLDWQHRIGQTRDYSNSLSALGTIALQAGNIQMAEEMFTRQLAVEQVLGRAIGLAESHENIGLVKQAQGDLVSAETHFRKMLSVGREHALSNFSVRALWGLAEIELANGNQAAACELVTISEGEQEPGVGIGSIQRKRLVDLGCGFAPFNIEARADLRR